MSNNLVRLQGGPRDHNKPGYVADGPHSARGTYFAEYKAGVTADGDTLPYLVVVDQGKERGRVVYFTPTDGTPGLAIPAGRRYGDNPQLVRGTNAGFRTLRDAKAFMHLIAEAGILPTDRAAKRSETVALRAVVEAYLDQLAAS